MLRGMAYDLDPLVAPRSTGGLLRVLVFLAERGFPGRAIARKFLRDVGVETLRAAAIDEGPAWSPPLPAAAAGGAPLDPAAAWPGGPAEGAEDFPFETVDRFARAYREGRATPEEVAERWWAAVDEADAADPPLRAFVARNRDDVMAQARASSERHRAGRPRGPLDGVPVAVKDEVDQVPYPTTVGTRFLGDRPAAADAETVARLRAAGALLVGKANMHEIGMGVTGLNPHHGAARNPYDPARATGGSSSGPAAATAAGLCPAALGADGGGSIRIPASLCGLVGLKPTFGRVSERGAAPLCWSVAHLGPIAASTRDAAIVYAAVAGPDPLDPATLGHPAPSVEGWDAGDLAGMRIGIDPAWFDHADPGVVKACRTTLDGLRGRGAEVAEFEIRDLALLRTAHLITIVSEMIASHLRHLRGHWRDYGHDVRLNLGLARHLAAADYVQAQRVRARVGGRMAEILGRVDAVATPTTTCTAPVLPDGGRRTGLSDLALGDRIMRNCVLANMTGLPAITFPAGFDEAGLPVGFQLIGRPWEEHRLLRAAAAAERFVVRRAPRVRFRLLDGQ
jgi:Asp-tRNA(Asn)/Glu-tRNA(Gln) amidotransferase A subunit family amidase